MEESSQMINRHNPGIDLLRVVAGCYVLLVHALVPSGIVITLQEGTLSYKIAWFLVAWGIGMVDIFALISGYTGYTPEERKTNWPRLIELWLEVVFYSAAGQIIFTLLYKPADGIDKFWEAFFPLTFNRYWFFSAYVGLMFIRPFIDMGLRYTEKAQLKRFIPLLVMSYSVFNFLNSSSDPFVLANGYSPFWITVLYIIGAAARKCELGKNISLWKLIVTGILMIVVSWLWKIYGISFRFLNIDITQDSLIGYTSPTVVITALLYVLIFSRLTFSAPLKKIIRFVSPSAFAIYLLNAHPLYYKYMFYGSLDKWVGRRASVLFTIIFLYVISFLIFALLTDKIRQFLFRFLHVQKGIRGLFARKHS